MEMYSAKSVEASKLRQRKYELVRKFQLPENLLGGSFGPSFRRCGKSTCHCVEGKGHIRWAITFSQQGKKSVESVPQDWHEEVGSVFLETKSYLDAIQEVMAINLELLVETKKQRKQQKVRDVKKKALPVWNSWKKRSTFSNPPRSI